VAERGVFSQTVIAVIWDFDKTLSPHYMQKPLFEAYGVDEDRFWREVNALPEYYARVGVEIQRDTCYLGHLLSYVRHGRFPGLTNAKLRELGARIEFFPGIPGLFDRLSSIVEADDLKVGDLQVELEHYVVSTGLKEMIRGSAIADRLAGIWASEFIEVPAAPDTDLGGVPGSGPISLIAGLLDNTTKTRALFEINKGVNKSAAITVNDSIPEDERRVPFKNMIYIADGPSDIPCFSVVNKNLREAGRVQDFGPADYSEGSHTDLCLASTVRRMARRIIDDRRQAFERKVSPGPTHLASPTD